MRIKLDENVHEDVGAALVVSGHDVHSVRSEGLNGRPDQVIAAAVLTEQRCLVTLDLDFADTRRYPPGEFPGIVVLRLRRPTIRRQVERVSDFFAAESDVVGHPWIIEETRARDWTP